MEINKERRLSNKVVFYRHVFVALCREEALIFSRIVWDKMINWSISIAVNVICMSYLLGQQFAIGGSDFAMFAFTGAIAASGLFEAYYVCFTLVGDYEGDKAISYYLTLPVPALLIFLKIMFCIMVRAVLAAFVAMIVGKMVLWNSLPFTAVNWLHFFLIFLVGNLFMGIFGVWLSTMIASSLKRENLWCRYIFPFWYFSGLQYTWMTMFKLSAPVAYLVLLNPLTYVMEGTRASMMGQQGYLNIWFCLGMLLVFTGIAFWHTMRGLKRRLDFV